MNDKQIEALRNGEFEILCPKMSLKKNDGTKSFEGSGIIRQVKQKHFEFIIFDRSLTGGFKENLEYDFHTKFHPGEMIPESDKYSLMTSEDWQVENIYGIMGRHTNDGCIIRGYTNELLKIIDNTNGLNFFKKRNPEKDNSFWFHRPGVQYNFFEHLEYPANKCTIKEQYIEDEDSHKSWSLNALKFNSTKYKIRIAKINEYIDYRVTSKRKRSKHNDLIEFRSLEVLQFMLGRLLQWNFKRVFSGNEERIYIRTVSKRISNNQDAKPPLFCRSKTDSMLFESLYLLYLKFILKDEKNQRHLISERLSEVFSASNGSFETHILTLATEIEGILADYHSENIQADSGFIEEIVKIKDLVKKNKKPLKISTSTCNKFCSHLGYLQKTKLPSKKIFERLIKNKKINSRDFKAWDSIRHKKAHGNKLGINQKQIDKRHQLTVLLYNIYFDLIGYKGEFTDYGELGYPTKDYPL